MSVHQRRSWKRSGQEAIAAYAPLGCAFSDAVLKRASEGMLKCLLHESLESPLVIELQSVGHALHENMLRIQGDLSGLFFNLSKKVINEIVLSDCDINAAFQ